MAIELPAGAKEVLGEIIACIVATALLFVSAFFKAKLEELRRTLTKSEKVNEVIVLGVEAATKTMLEKVKTSLPKGILDKLTDKQLADLADAIGKKTREGIKSVSADAHTEHLVRPIVEKVTSGFVVPDLQEIAKKVTKEIKAVKEDSL